MINKIIDKLLSGRFFATVAVVGTYCIVMVGSVYMAISKILSVEAFLGLMSGFSLLTREICDSYFKRSDRAIEQPKKENGTNA